MSGDSPFKEEAKLLHSELDAACESVTTLPPFISSSVRRKKDAPQIPDWALSRSALSCEPIIHASPLQTVSKTVLPLCDDDIQKDKCLKLGNLPLPAQEYLILEDLLYIMMGIEGNHIHIHGTSENVEFEVDSSLDISLSNLLERLLPLCSDSIFIRSFCGRHRRYEYGLVMHSLCFALDGLIKEYLIVVGQLEHQFHANLLTMQKVTYYVSSLQNTMSILARACREINKTQVHGGALLNRLHALAVGLAGDTQATQVMQYLLKEACVPLMAMVKRWIEHGVVDDPYDEFFIVEQESLVKENITTDYLAAYWEERYTLREKMLPVFFVPLSRKILITGKYLNVIRECKHSQVRTDNIMNAQFSGNEIPPSISLEYTPEDDESYYSQIEKAFSWASRSLLDLLRQKKLLPCLKSIKRHFLLDQGDFFVHFMDISYSELKKPVNEINVIKLNSLLQLALRTSTSESDPFKDQLECNLLPYTLTNQLLSYLRVSPQTGAVEVVSSKTTGPTRSSRLTGLEAFSFDFSVPFPLSLILSPASLIKYQLLFRHLFMCKYVERRLSTLWLSIVGLSKSLLFFSKASAFGATPFSTDNARLSSIAGIFSSKENTYKENILKCLQSINILRQRMGHFLHNFLYFLTVEVIEPQWHKFEKALLKVSTVDELLKYHGDFLDSCLVQSTLTENRLVKVTTKLMSLCALFTNFGDNFVKGFSTSEGCPDSSLISKTLDAVKQLETNFNVYLGQLIRAPESPHMARLITSLDFNDFYSTKHGLLSETQFLSTR